MIITHILGDATETKDRVGEFDGKVFATEQDAAAFALRHCICNACRKMIDAAAAADNAEQYCINLGYTAEELAKTNWLRADEFDTIKQALADSDFVSLLDSVPCGCEIYIQKRVVVGQE